MHIHRSHLSAPRNRDHRAHRALLALSVGVLAFGGLTACGDDDPVTVPDPEPTVAAFPETYRQDYSQVRGCKQSGGGHDNEYMTVHADPSSATAYLSEDYPFDEGATIVKTLYSSDTCDPSTVVRYAVMVKGPAGTDPDHNDWIWQDVAASRAVTQEGSLASCAGCHSACLPADYVCAEADPEPVESYGLIETWMGTGINGQGVDGPIREVHLSIPQDLTFGPDGRAYILDWNNHRVRQVENGVSETIIGTGQLGDAHDGPGIDASLNHPTHISFDPADGNMIMSAWHNSKVMKYDMSTGILRSICGNGERSYGGDDGPAIEAVLDLPVCSIFDAEGNLWITDVANQCVRMIDTSGVIRTVVGTRVAGFSGDGGPAIDAQIFMPIGQQAPPVGRACFDAEGNYYLADSFNHVIRMVDTAGIIHTVAGTPGQRGSTGDGGPATEAKLYRPSDVAIGPHGDLFIADTWNSLIRKVDKETGVITTITGQPGVAPGYGGDGGHPSEATLYQPFGIEFDAEGNLYIADTNNNRIRVIWRYR